MATKKFQRNEGVGFVGTTTTLNVRDLIKLEKFLCMTDFFKSFVNGIQNGSAYVASDHLGITILDGVEQTLDIQELHTLMENLETFLKNMGVTAPKEEEEPIF